MLSEYPFSAFDIFQLFGPVIVLFINRYKKNPPISEKMHFVQFFYTRWFVRTQAAQAQYQRTVGIIRTCIGIQRICVKW